MGRFVRENSGLTWFIFIMRFCGNFLVKRKENDHELNQT